MNDRFEIGLRGMQSCIIYADPGFIIAPSLDLGDLNIASWALFPLAPPPTSSRHIAHSGFFHDGILPQQPNSSQPEIPLPGLRRRGS